MSATVTGTGCTVVGAYVLMPCAITVVISASAAIRAAKASTTGREPGRATGSLNPSRGCAAGADRTRSNARATSTCVSGTASSVAIERASSEKAFNRELHSGQASRCAPSEPARASGSSTILRSVPSLRCATSNLLAQCFLCAPQQSSNLSDTDAERLRDLGVAQAARAQDQRGRGLGGHPAQRLSQAPPVLVELSLHLRIQAPLGFLDRLGDLPALPAPVAPQPVQCGVGGGPVQPRRGVSGPGRV